MTTFYRTSPRRAARVAVAGVALLAAVHGAAAEDDGGVHAFFSSMFGGGGQARPTRVDLPSSRVPYAPENGGSRARQWRSTRYRPLTVRLHAAKPHPSMIAAAVPTKPGKVSIYEDKTLRRGDAVMTADGIRIFAGSNSWPYAKADFVSIGSAKNLDRSTVKVLAELNSLPRS